MDFSLQTTTETPLTVEDVYLSRSIVIPQGWEVIAFRSPRKGETLLSSVAGAVIESTSNYGNFAPRLILRKVRKQIGWKVVITDEEPQPIKGGEYSAHVQNGILDSLVLNSTIWPTLCSYLPVSVTPIYEGEE